MRRFSLILATMAVFYASAFAQFNHQNGTPAAVAVSKKDAGYQTVDLIANKTVTVEGTLKKGTLMESLSWASRSTTACFPATQNAKFNGNHVLFVTQMPPRSILKITVKPKNNGVNLSIYGYQLGLGRLVLPKDLSSCVSCEAEHKWDYPKKGKTQDDSRTISLNTIANPYSVVVGVTGANGLTDSDFTVEFSLEK